MAEKKHNSIVDSFRRKVNEAITGDNQARDIMRAVNEMLRAYEILLPDHKNEPHKKPGHYEKPEHHKEPDCDKEPKKNVYPTWPIQRGYFHNN